MSDLTQKQRRFVEEYLLDLNATKAAIRAGYSSNGANTAGPRLLSDPRVIAAIDAAKIERSERTKIDADWVLQRLSAEVEADLADLYDENGALLPVEEWPLIWRQGLVAGVDTDEIFEGEGKDRINIGQVKKLKLSDRLRRLELIGKHVRVNAFQETIEHKGFDSLAERLERAHARRNIEGEGASLDEPRPILPVNPPPAVAPAPRPTPKGEIERPVVTPEPVPTAARTASYRPILPLPSEKPTLAVVDYDQISPGEPFSERKY